MIWFCVLDVAAVKVGYGAGITGTDSGADDHSKFKLWE